MIGLLLRLMIVSLILWLIGEIITGIITEMLTGDSKANELTKFQFLKYFLKYYVIFIIGIVLIAMEKMYHTTGRLF